MRLIDADRLKEVLKRNTGYDYSELIDIQPTVDVLDKIRIEIRNEQNMDYKCHRKTYDNCLRIIDKYREEKARIKNEIRTN